MDDKVREEILAFWDYLADQPVSRANESLHALLDFVAKKVTAKQAYWLGAIRLKKQVRDPLLGWRPVAIQHLCSVEEPQKVFRKGVRGIRQGEVSESMVNHASQAGAFRAVLLKDHVSPAFFETDHYQHFYTDRGYADCLFVVTPVNEDVEAYYGFYRSPGQGAFTEDDLAIAAFALRGLKWFQRLVMLDHGLLVVDQPLSPVERRILRYLLTDQSEQQIAEHMGHSPATTHKYVTTLYRKFNVNGRAGLAALWLGH